MLTYELDLGSARARDLKRLFAIAGTNNADQRADSEGTWGIAHLRRCLRIAGPTVAKSKSDPSGRCVLRGIVCYGSWRNH
ncbi:hypothetical protein D9M71_677280 [compost metagenome]